MMIVWRFGGDAISLGILDTRRCETCEKDRGFNITLQDRAGITRRRWSVTTARRRRFLFVSLLVLTVHVTRLAGGSFAAGGVPAAAARTDLVAGSGDGLATVVQAADCRNPFAAGPLPSGSGPVAVAVDRSRDRLYVMHRDLYDTTRPPLSDFIYPSITNRVSIVSLSTGAVLGVVPIGTAAGNNGNTQGIAVDSTRNRIWATNYADGTVSVIDGGATPPTVVRTITIATNEPYGREPTSVAVDTVRNRVFVASENRTVTIYNATTFAVVATVNLTAPAYGVTVDTSTGIAYVIESLSTFGRINTSNALTEFDSSRFFPRAAKAITVANGSQLYLAYQNKIIAFDISGSTPANGRELLVDNAFVQDTTGLDVDQVFGEVYAVSANASTLYVFGPSGNLVTRLTTQQFATRVAVDGVSGRAYIADTLSGSVTVVNMDSRTVAGRILLGTSNWGLALDSLSTQRRLYSANFLGRAVTVLNPTDCSTVATYGTTDAPWAVGVDPTPSVSQLYTLNIATNFAGTVQIFDLITGALKRTISIGTAAAGRIAVNRNTHKVYVTPGRATANTLTIIDGVTNTATTVTVGLNPVGVAVDEAANKVYVASQQAGVIYVLDGATNAILQRWTPAPPASSSAFTPWGLALDTSARRLWVTLNAATLASFNGVMVLDADTGEKIAEIELPLYLPSERFMGQIAVSPTTHRAYAAVPARNEDSGYTTNRVAVIDPASGYGTALVNVGLRPEDVVIDETTAKVYIGNANDGTISVINDESCNNTLSSTSQSVAAAAGSITIDVSAGATCGWTARPNASWLSVTPTTGAANGRVTLSWLANAGTQRSGTVTIAGRTVTITQAAPVTCSYSVSPTSHSASAASGFVDIAVTTTSGCTWTASSGASWLTTPTSTGSGSGTVRASYGANTGAGRSATVAIAGQTVTVAQAAGTSTCSYGVSPTSHSPSASSGTFDIMITASSACSWSASSNVSWLTVSPANGSGDGTIMVSRAANAGAERSGTLTIAGQTVTVTQAAGSSACSYTLSSTSESVSAAEGWVNITVTTSPACTWNASSAAPWVMVSPSSGTGNGAVTVAWSGNTGAARTGTLMIAGQSVTVTQAAGATTCAYSVSPTSHTASASAGSAAVTITTTAGCAWSANAGVPWLNVFPSAGSGSSTVAISWAANSTAQRTGSATIAGQTVTVTQAGGSDAPSNLEVTSMSGSMVTLSWTAPTGATPSGYLLEGGTAAGQTLGSTATGSTATSFTFNAPTGVWFARIRALYGLTRSVPTNEVRIVVNMPGTASAPTSLLGLVNGSALALSWTNTTGGGAATGVQLNVTGTLSGTLSLPLSDVFSFPAIPPGTYTFTVAAVNAAGSSTASNPVTLTFPSPCSGVPSMPTNFMATRSGNTIALSWSPPASGHAVTGYTLIVTGAFVGNVPTTSRSLSGTVGPGSYTFNVAAMNPCGTGAATGAQTIIVP